MENAKTIAEYIKAVEEEFSAGNMTEEDRDFFIWASDALFVK